MKKLSLRRPKEPNEPTGTSLLFPRKRHRVDLQTLLFNRPIDACSQHDEASCFEDANSIYFLDYAESGPHLTLAMDKNLYDNGISFFDLSLLDFDARFIFGRGIKGKLKFGNYTDNNLGRVFHLTEPKDATHMYLSLLEFSGALEWLKDAPEVCYFRHTDLNHHLYAVLHVGTRLDSEKHQAIVHYNKSLEDRNFYQEVFEEHLQNFAGIPVKIAEYTDREPELAIKEIREIEEANRRGAERRLELEKLIDETSVLLRDSIADYLSEFGLDFKLEIADEFLRIGSREVVAFTLFEASRPSGIIFRMPTEIEVFSNSTTENNAKRCISEATRFLDIHRDAYKAYKRLYDANRSYHEYVNPASKEPVLDYPHIFGADSFIY